MNRKSRMGIRIRHVIAGCALLLAGARTTPAFGSTIYWGGSSAEWTNAANWVGGVAPKNGNAGMITNGQAWVASTNGLYNPAGGETPPSEIRVQSGGTLLYKTGMRDQLSLRDHNLVLDGGTFATEDSDNSYYRYSYDIRVRSNSVVSPNRPRTDRGGQFLWYGFLKDYDSTHSGIITKIDSGVLALYATNYAFSGGWSVQNNMVYAMTNGALGTGNIVITNAGTVAWAMGGASDTTIPSVVVQSGGTFALNGNNSHFACAPGKSIILQNGGVVGTLFADYQTYYLDAPLYVSGNVTLAIQNRIQALYLSGDISNSAPATITRFGYFNNSDNGMFLSHANISYTGDWIIVGPTLTAQNDGALGTGKVDLRPGTSLPISKDLKLYNQLTGVGTAGTSGKTLTLQPRYTNSVFTAAGVAPGTNSPATVGTLAVGGNLAFTNLPAYDGITTGYCTLTTKLQDDPLNPGLPANDLLAAAGNVTGLSNVDLTINALASLPALQRGSPRTLVTAANNFSGLAFHSVTWLGQTGTISYVNGAVKVAFLYPGPLVDNAGGATNLTSQSACLNGTVTSTGAAPTHVWVYWGTTDGGTNVANWANPPVDLGFCGTGLVTTTVSSLSSDTAYYYRFYADNGSGSQWAVASATFWTMPDYTQYGYRMKIQFTGYTKGEPLTNFPALVSFSTTTPGFLYSLLASTNGNDLRFSNSNATKNLNYEIERWNTNGTSAVWVQMDVLASSNDYIWAYYGNSAAAASPVVYATNGAAWAAGFVAVWHMNQPNALDSTANRNNGTASANTNVPAGYVSTAQGFNGSAFIQCPSSSSFDTLINAVTISTWVNLQSAGSYPMMFTRGQDKLELRFNQGTRQLEFESPADLIAGSATAVALGNWNYVVGTYNQPAAIERLFINGQMIASSTPNNAMANTGYAVYLGKRTDGYNLTGYMDEMRVENVARSSNWVWACYMNMASNSAFNSNLSQLATPVISNQGGVSNKTAFSADLNGYLSWTGSAPTEVYVFYGKQDQFPNRTGWDGSVYLGTQSVGSVVAHVSGLTPNTNYLYRCYATNAFGEYWASPTSFVTPPDSVAVDNAAGASGLTAFQATLNGDLVSTGGAPTAVWVFFGDAAHAGGTGGTNKALWMTSFFLGNSIPQAAFLSTNVYGLSQGTAYYYNFYASNTLGTAWGVATNFTTLSSIDYTDKAAGVWNSTSTWTPSTGYPSNAYDSATIQSNTVQATAGYVVPAIRSISLTTNANGSATGTLWFADTTVQTAPLLLNGGMLKLQDDGNYAQPNNLVTVKASSQINLVGSGNHRSWTILNFNGSFQDSVQGGVTNTGVIVFRGSDCAGMNLNASANNFSGGWDIMAGPYLDSDGYRPALNVCADGALGTGTAIVRNALSVFIDQTNAPAPARVIVPAGSELWQVKSYGDGNNRTIQSWEIELQGGVLGNGKYGQSQFLGGHLYLTASSTMYGHRDYRGWGPDFRYGGTIVGAGRLTIDADRGGSGSQIFRLSGNNGSFSGGVTVLWNALYVENTGALGTGDCWFDSADANGGVYLNTTPATTNWVLPNNLGGINTIQVEDGSGAYTLTVPGRTVQPGTNVNASGQLTVAGNLAFGTDGVGGTSTLIVDVTGAGGVAGTDFDRLVVTHTLSGLSNATLAVNLATNLAQNALAGQELIIATNAAALASTFPTVTFSGAWHGKVAYNQPAGTVKLYQVSAVPPAGLVILIR